MAVKKKVKRKPASTYTAPSAVTQAAQSLASKQVSAAQLPYTAGSQVTDLRIAGGEGEVVRAPIVDGIKKPDVGGNITTTADGLTLVSMGDANVEQAPAKAKVKKKVTRRQAMEQRTNDAAQIALEKKRIEARLRERTMIEGL